MQNTLYGSSTIVTLNAEEIKGNGGSKIYATKHPYKYMPFAQMHTSWLRTGIVRVRIWPWFKGMSQGCHMYGIKIYKDFLILHFKY